MKKIILTAAVAVLAIGTASAQGDNASQNVNVNVAPMVAIDFDPPATPGSGAGDPVALSFANQSDMWSGVTSGMENIRVQSTAAWKIQVSRSAWGGDAVDHGGMTLKMKIAPSSTTSGVTAANGFSTFTEVGGTNATIATGVYGPTQNINLWYNVSMAPGLDWAQAGNHSTTVTYTSSLN